MALKHPCWMYSKGPKTYHPIKESPSIANLYVFELQPLKHQKKTTHKFKKKQHKIFFYSPPNSETKRIKPGILVQLPTPRQLASDFPSLPRHRIQIHPGSSVEAPAVKTRGEIPFFDNREKPIYSWAIPESSSD